MVTANNKVTGATKEFSPLEWEMMQDWPGNEWVKVAPAAPSEAKKAAKDAKAKAEEDAKAKAKADEDAKIKAKADEDAKAKAEEDARIKAALENLPPVEGREINDQNPPII